MKARKFNVTTFALLAGITTGAFATAGPQDACDVNTREELDLLCPMGNPICCKFFTYTRLLDTYEVFYSGQIYPGTYTPIW